ncbi:MAG TPA: lysylphosphatidylglycerol synthase transmembrane domain-containing protein, partial [Bryobacteraceae bacterium]|nr:lysylphosphatidylglycerol synthase transmembrane domain-containing protein [Bryobacteraceae bacterium]
MENPAHASRRRTLRAVIGYCLAAACLVWLFHDVNWAAIGRDLRGIRWSWVAVAIALIVLSYGCQGWRWSLLLRPIGALSAFESAQAVYAGLFTNEILPMRMGEVVRAYLVSRWLGVGVSDVVPSMVVERLFDGVWLALALGATAIFVERLPPGLLRAGDIVGALVMAAAALFAFMVLRKRAPRAEPKPESRFILVRKVARLAGSLEAGLREIGRSRTLYVSFGVSAFVLGGQMTAFWLILRAYGIRLPFWTGVAAMLIVQLGTLIPNAPANVGTYQFFAVVGLELFGVDRNVATGFSLVV